MLFLIPPFLNALMICFHESVRFGLVIFSLVTALATFGILYPRSNNAMLNYTNGFLLSWQVIWSFNLLYVFNIDSLKCVRIRRFRGSESCYYESLGDTTGLRRFLWAFDLALNFRGTGWMAIENNNSYWPPQKYTWWSSSSQSSKRRLAKLGANWFLFGLGQHLLQEPTHILPGTKLSCRGQGYWRLMQK